MSDLSIKVEFDEDASLTVSENGDITEVFRRIAIEHPERVRIETTTEPDLGRRMVISIDGRPLVDVREWGELLIFVDGKLLGGETS